MEKFCEKPTYIRILPCFRMIKYKSASIFCHIWFEKRARRLCKKLCKKVKEDEYLVWSFDFLFQNCAAARKLQKFFILLLFSCLDSSKKVLFHSWYSQILSLSKIWKAVKVVFFKSIQILIFLLRSSCTTLKYKRMLIVNEEQFFILRNLIDC